MKALKVAAIVVAALAGLAVVAPTSAYAYYRGAPHGNGYYWRGPSVGFYYGGPYYGYGWGSPWYYGSGYGYPYGYGYGGYGYGYGYGYGGYYAAPSYLYGPPAVAYIERDQPVTTTPQVQQPQPQAAPAVPAAPAGQWWYLCSSPRGAYPNVRECPGGWERVPAIPPGQVK
jgi:hypothetical protein